MDKLSEFVFPHLKELESKLKFLKATGCGLPKWWKSELHDQELLDGVKEHGFDFKKIFTEEKYSFSIEKKTCPREGLCLTRLENICTFFEKMLVVGSPTTENMSQWNFTPKKTHINLPKEIKKKKTGKLEEIINEKEEEGEEEKEEKKEKKGKITDFFEREKRKREEEEGEKNKTQKIE